MPLSGSKDEHFSYFHRSCQLGLNWDHLSSFLSTSVWARTPAYFKVHSRAFHRIKSKYEEQNWNIQNNFKSKWISRINFIIRGIFSFLFQVHKHTIPSYAGATEGTYIVSALICTIFTIYDEISLVKICVGAYRMALNVKLSKKKYSPTEHSALKWTNWSCKMSLGEK